MDRLFYLAMDIGEQMLIVGAEVYRVEDSLNRILKAMGATRVDVFVITNNMTVTVYTDDGASKTQTRRIKDTGTDYEKLHKLNALSRKICSQKMSADEIERELISISSSKKYPQWLISLAYSLISGAFTLFFGGGLVESAVSFLVGFVVSFVVLICDRTIKNKIFAKFMSSLVATALAFVAVQFSLISSMDKVLIGNIMTLIPGVGLTNAVRDLFVGDSVAGVLRTIEACLAAFAIAAGYFVLIFLTGGIAV